MVVPRFAERDEKTRRHARHTPPSANMRDTPGATKRIMSGQRGCKSAATVPWVASLIIFPTGLRFSHADPPIYHGHSVVVNLKETRKRFVTPF